MSGAAQGYVRKALPLAYTDLGEQQVKNGARPLKTKLEFRAAMEGLSGSGSGLELARGER